MGKKTLLIIVFLLLLFYPLFSIFQLEQVLSSGGEILEGQEKLKDLQRSIWIIWVFMVSLSVYFKWTFKKNMLFYFTYGFLFVAFSVFGIYVQRLVTHFDVASNFEDTYTLGIISAVQNIITSVVLTAFLQAAVWWFTRRWHRR